MGSILEPGRPPKVDTVILSDALRMMTQLRNEAHKLKKSCEDLQKEINELKVCLQIFFYLMAFCPFSSLKKAISEFSLYIFEKLYSGPNSSFVTVENFIYVG